MACTICHECYDTKLKVPKVLSCGHTFCNACLVELETEDCVPCPLRCEPRSHRPLPTNFALVQLIEEREPLLNVSAINIDGVAIQLMAAINAKRHAMHAECLLEAKTLSRDAVKEQLLLAGAHGVVNLTLRVNDFVSALDHVNRWCVAQIIDENNDQFHVTFLHWKSKWNEWISKESPRLVPLARNEALLLWLKRAMIK